MLPLLLPEHIAKQEVKNSRVSSPGLPPKSKVTKSISKMHTLWGSERRSTVPLSSHECSRVTVRRQSSRISQSHTQLPTTYARAINQTLKHVSNIKYLGNHPTMAAANWRRAACESVARMSSTRASRSQESLSL